MDQLSGKQIENFANSFFSQSQHLSSEEDLNQLISDFDADLLCSQMESLSVDQLVKFLRASHGYYLTKKLPEIEQSLAHIVNKFGSSHSLLAGLAVYFNNYKTKLVKHIRMEEEMFFPFIETLAKAQEGKFTNKELELLLKNTTVEDFEDNHDSVEDELREVGQIIREYAAKSDAIFPFSVFLNQVSLFEYELRKHAVIEDMVLVKKVVELEKELRENLAA
ncbi:hemerythrin [Jiulongibacter sediminis]|uniref:hemerythrin n=1 Tax=Jiulongibacter sediminis TaxID=1605367 RepID=UPI0026F20B34|nr:hemerythrin [Jiulongibacter sediminis]